MRSRAKSALLGFATVAAAMSLALGGLGGGSAHDAGSLAESARGWSVPGTSAKAGRAVSSAPGLPPRVDAVSNRSWHAIAWDAIGPEAMRLAPGGSLDEAGRERILGALSRLRDAARGVKRSEGDARREVEAARRQRAAALEADRVFREEIGMPLGAFLDRVEPGGVEDVG